MKLEIDVPDELYEKLRRKFGEELEDRIVALLRGLVEEGTSELSPYDVAKIHPLLIMRMEEGSDHFVVMVRVREGQDEIAELIESAGGKVRRKFRLVPVISAIVDKETLLKLSKDSRVVAIEPVYEVEAL